MLWLERLWPSHHNFRAAACATSIPPTLLFVYGTLRPDSGHPVAKLLADHAHRLGPASLPGALFDLGSYPGAVEAPDLPHASVQGELLSLRDASILRHLDDYEGRDYERTTREVRLWDGSTVEAVVYLYRGAVGEARRVLSGDWLPE